MTSLQIAPLTRSRRCCAASCSLALLALLAACAGQGAHTSATQEAARYAARARGNYVPPGPPEDPWGPYIREAGKRFDVPETLDPLGHARRVRAATSIRTAS